MRDSFLAGFEKVAFKTSLFRKALRPIAVGTAGAGIAGGGYSVGKGTGKEEQLIADRAKFEQYLEADYSRDVQNLQSAAQQSFVQGYDSGAKDAMTHFQKALDKKKQGV